MIARKLQGLREELRERGLDGYLITGTDPHQSEYVPLRWRTREFISGFTGSAGTVVVTMDKALLWTDSRYWIQAVKELDGTGFILMRDGDKDVPSVSGWLAGSGLRIGADGLTLSLSEKMRLEKAGVDIVITGDLLSPLWPDRPSVPCTQIREVGMEQAGLSASKKLDAVRSALREKGADWTLISSLDDIAWLTNLRADDIPYNPVFVSYAFISQDKAILFVDSARFSDEIMDEVASLYSIASYESIMEEGKGLFEGKGYISPERTSASIASMFSSFITGRDITTDMKARKNETELEGMRKAHILDGVAYVRFLSRLDRNGKYTEMGLARMLEDERARIEGYQGPSFSPISGWKEHGAIVHYAPDEESDAIVEGSGLLVLDTGSQFSFGMTDITRTLLFGEATEEEKRDYTLVLKGHLALARAIFIEGTRGVQLDVLAKQFLWREGESFFHGTGHGVGCNLSVHEGPQRISSALIDVPLRLGMVISDEPGVYKEGRHGIRIENLVTVREARTTEFGTFYSFETLTLVPYERALLDMALLTDEEINQINCYHEVVRKTLSHYLDSEALRWLESATAPIEK